MEGSGKIRKEVIGCVERCVNGPAVDDDRHGDSRKFIRQLQRLVDVRHAGYGLNDV